MVYTHNYFMNKAIQLAELSANENEVPVGCIIVKNNQIIAQAHNNIENSKNSLNHAEIIAINQAITHTAYKHLLDCQIYITLEPCSMCAGAIILARIPTVIIAALDPKSGAAKSVFNILENNSLNHKPDVIYNIETEKSSNILKSFFKSLRNSKK